MKWAFLRGGGNEGEPINHSSPDGNPDLDW